MAVPTGQVGLSDIAAEYGGSAPHAMSEYYGKGNAAGSGQMLLHANFQGTSNIFTFNISSGANKNFRTLAVAAGWDQSAIPHGTLSSGQILSSGSTGSYAFVINGSLPSGSKFINNGTIVGRGGNGGSSSGNDRNCITGGGSTGSGTSAGPGLQISTAIIIHNSGRVAGGGGGGGAGGRGANTYGAGGGGGGGIGGSSGGSSNHAGVLVRVVQEVDMAQMVLEVVLVVVVAPVVVAVQVVRLLQETAMLRGVLMAQETEV